MTELLLDGTISKEDSTEKLLQMNRKLLISKGKKTLEEMWRISAGDKKPDEFVLIHGDAHSGNILTTLEGNGLN